MNNLDNYYTEMKNLLNLKNTKLVNLYYLIGDSLNSEPDSINEIDKLIDDISLLNNKILNLDIKLTANDYYYNNL